MDCTTVIRSQKSTCWLSFLLGVCSVIGQILLLRELIIVFYGNETSYAIILACWLTGVSIGSFCATRISPALPDLRKTILLVLVLIALAVPATVLFPRFLNAFLNITTGEIIDIFTMLKAALLIVFPLTFLNGFFYTLICRLQVVSGKGSAPSAGIGGVYFWESAGSALGGVLFSFIFIHFLSALQLAFYLSFLMLFSGAFLICKTKRTLSFAVFFLVAFIVLGGNKKIDQLDRFSRARQWKGYDLIASEDSIYGNIVLVKRGGEFSLYENGLLSYTTGDELTSEETALYPMLAHPDPKTVLLVGGGMAGHVEQILKYPQAKVDYIEIDPKVIDISRRYLAAGQLKFLNSPRVTVRHLDARRWIKMTERKYDVVIIALSDPFTAFLNRYYTYEFFGEVYRILTPKGVASLRVSSSENYINEETAEFLRSIHSTLKAVFPGVISLPGAENMFLACRQSGIIQARAEYFIAKLKESGVEAKFINEHYLPFNFSPDRLAYINKILEQDGQINTDQRPIAYLFDIQLWSTHFQGPYRKILKSALKINGLYLLILPLFLLPAVLFLRNKPRAFPVQISILTTGFSEIVFQIVIIIAFQTLYGYTYYRIGLIIASFMAGLVGGAYCARIILSKKAGQIKKYYLTVQGMICCYPLVLPFVFAAFRDVQIMEAFPGLFSIIFAVLPVIAGFMGGLQYPLAIQLIPGHATQRPEQTAVSAGVLYSIDVLGAMLGALLTAAFFIPLYGMNFMAYFCSILNAVVFILLFVNLKADQ